MHINCCIHATLQRDKIMFLLKKMIFYTNFSAILDFNARNVFKYQIDVRNGFLVVELAKKSVFIHICSFYMSKVIFS